MSHNTAEPTRRYQFFILGLRLREDTWPGERLAWRISLEDPHTAERSGFNTLAELDAFLQAWMDERVGSLG